MNGKALTMDPDAYSQLGNMLYQSQQCQSALEDGFLRCLQSMGNPKSNVNGQLDAIVGGGGISGIYNMCGLCHTSLGNYEEGKEAFTTALAIDQGFKEAWVNLGQLQRDHGNAGEATGNFARAFALDATYTHAYHLSGLCFHSQGNLAMAISAFMGGLRSVRSGQEEGINHKNKNTNSNVPSLFQMLGVSFQSLGLYPRAIEHFKQVQRSMPSADAEIIGTAENNLYISKYSAWYNREMAFFFWSKLDSPIESWELDDGIPTKIKEGFSKRADYKDLETSALKNMQASKSIPPVDLRKSLVGCKWLEKAVEIGRFIQLKSPGFVANNRQHRQFGLAVLEASQFLDITAMNCTWREMMNVIVKWRQISEPNDSVWWIDMLTEASLKMGFGLQTPIVSGELKVFRYYSYFNKAFGVLKKFMVSQCKLSDGVGTIVKRAKTLEEIWNLVGEDFWVTVPCVSEVTNKNMEGTRLTLQRCHENMNAHNTKNKVGFEFTIRTPSTPQRFKDFGEQFDKLWEELRELSADDDEGDDEKRVGGGEGGHGGGDGADAGNNRLRRWSRYSLKFFYYWVSFSPLTRGSAAAGYAALVAILRFGGYGVQGGMKEGVQLDWEAILSDSFENFISEQLPWLTKSCVDIDEEDDAGGAEENIMEVLPDLRSRIEALNVTDVGEPNALSRSLG